MFLQRYALGLSGTNGTEVHGANLAGPSCGDYKASRPAAGRCDGAVVEGTVDARAVWLEVGEAMRAEADRETAVPVFADADGCLGLTPGW